MYRYSSQKQLSLDDYMNNLGKRLNANNRWIRLADHLPWDEFAKIYSSSLSEDMGRPGKDARLVIGAMIIKSIKRLPDEDVIPFPTDVDLLNKAREETERLIDFLWEPGPGKRKPRTYRQNARRDYLNVVKKKRKSKKVLRQGRKKQLGYVGRNLKTIKMLLLPYKETGLPFSPKDLKLLQVIHEVYRQQKILHETGTKSIPDCIVSLPQPHVRPIVRGKSGRDTEFGAKLSCSLVDGYAYLDHLNWNAFNENSDLKMHVEKYFNRFGFYHVSVHADQIYGTRENRNYLKVLGIQYAGKALGRSRQMTREEKRAFKKAMGIRSRIEGKFGEGKRKYDLGLVKAKTQMTSESWIASVFFVMNLAHWLRADSFAPLLSTFVNRFLDRLKFFKEQFAVMYRLQTV